VTKECPRTGRECGDSSCLASSGFACVYTSGAIFPHNIPKEALERDLADLLREGWNESDASIRAIRFALQSAKSALNTKAAWPFPENRSDGD
jgi:hypothetical protein